MPGIRNPFESYYPRRLGNPTEENVGRLGRLKFDPWSASDIDDRESEPAVPRRDWSQYLAEVKDIYSKTGPAQAAYESHLRDLPQQENPSVWGRIVAGIVGAGTGFAEGPSRGIAAGQGIIRRPYERQLEEWQNKEAGLSRSAEIEEKGLGRRLGYLKEEREIEKEKALEEDRLRDDQLKREAQEDLARYRDAQIEDMKGRGWVTLPTNAAGETIMANPRTGEEKNFGKALAGVRFEEDVRHRGVTEQQGWDASKRGWANVSLGQSNLGMRGKEYQLSAEAGGRAQAADERAEEANERARATYLQGPHIPVPEQTAATRLAAAQVVAEYPDAAKFIDEKGGIKPPGEELHKGYPTSAADLEHFKRFMQEVEKKKREALGLRRPGTPISGLSGSKEQPRADIVK